MPGASPAQAVDAFLEPLRESVACLGTAHLSLTPKARKQVGETHGWTLNRGNVLSLGDGLGFTASMRFETLDLGATRGRERFKVSTRGYMYSILARDRELIAFHWHPDSSSPVTDPHMHFYKEALSGTGVFLARAHIPTERRSFEATVRWLIEELNVTPARDDWDECLRRNEASFMEHRSW